MGRLVLGFPELRAEARRGGRTHYAFDVVDEAQDSRKLARVVVVDTSMGSLAASDAQSEPKEPGGQIAWLERMLCFEGSATDTDDLSDCTREPGQKAIVVSNRPTYTYAQIDPSKLQQDAATFEAILLRHDVDALVTGHLGWNGLYYTCAPGLHYPAPGQAYPTRAPKGVADCVAASGSEDAPDVANEAASAVAGTPAGALPVIVASGAGGVLADETGDAADGFWHGYSIVHLDTETGDVTVEQRPVFEWVAIRGDERTLEPGQGMRLRGYGRETFGQETPVRHREIDSPAVTHRYDLLLADPADPRVPCEATDEACVQLAERLAGSRSLGSASNEAARSARDDNVGGASGSGSAQDDMGGASGASNARGSGLASQHGGAAGSATAAMQELTPSENCEPYVCLPENVASVDSTTGDVRAGNGKYPDTFAIGMLSVGDHVATYPMVFTKSPSFIVSPSVGAPAVPSAPTNTGTAPAPPPPPNPPTPNVPQVNTPAPPPVPPIAPLSATQPPEPQPPAPPTPPPPTEQPAPLSLTLAPPSIAIATPTAVIQPPTPPVNPAPPGGARREARQRQAAAQKSGADSDEASRQSDQTQMMGGDLAEGPPSHQASAGFTRHDHSFTRVSGLAMPHRVGGGGQDPRGGVALQDLTPPARPAPSFSTAPRSRSRYAFTALERADNGSPALLYAGGVTLLALVAALGRQGVRPTPRRRPPEAPAPAFSRARIRG